MTCGATSHRLEDRYRCISIDLPLGAHRCPLSTGSRPIGHLAGSALLDRLELLDVEDATVVANDTARGLLLLSRTKRSSGARPHRSSRPDELRQTTTSSHRMRSERATALCRAFPRLARALLRLQLRSPTGRRSVVSTVASSGLDDKRAESFFGPLRVINGSPTISSPPWPVSARIASSRPPRQSRSPTGRSC